MKYSLAPFKRGDASLKRYQIGIGNVDTGSQGSKAEPSLGVTLALVVPVACTLISLTWAIASYWIVRERSRAQIELARLEIEAKR